MKILDIPQSGKRGITVSQGGRFGQISRALVIPTNPQTPAQMEVRSNLSRVTKAWANLTEAQRLAWHASAKTINAKSRCGTTGALTGSNLHTRVNCTNLTFDAPMADTPPGAAEFLALAPVGLVITNTNNVIALQLTCPSDPGANTIVRASSPQSAGVSTCRDLRIIGLCPAPLQGSASITALYVAKYGAPVAGQKVFVRCNTFVNGVEDLGSVFMAIVPDAA